MTCGKRTENNLKYCSSECYNRFWNYKRYHKDLTNSEISLYFSNLKISLFCKYCGISLKHNNFNSIWCERSCYEMYNYYKRKGFSHEQIIEKGKNKVHKCKTCKEILSAQMIDSFGFFCTDLHRYIYLKKKKPGI